MNSVSTTLECFCTSPDFETIHIYETAPAGEVLFSFSKGKPYRRELRRCKNCGHYISVHEMKMAEMYAGDYVSSTYQDEAGMKATFDRIVALPPEKSDNTGRVARIDAFASNSFTGIPKPWSVLDIGSGLCIFLHRMKASGWACTALDPDERAARHAANSVGVKAICADFMKAQEIGRYQLVTFNKVLEHVEDPVRMLSKSRDVLARNGLVYVELPDAEAAAKEGFGREEFFIDHHHVFSLASLALFASRAGFRVLSLERLREPSAKFTLRAFLQIND